MKRKSFVSVSVFLLLVVGLCYLWFTAPAKKNSIQVSVQEKLFLDKVVIQKGFYSISSENDESLVVNGLGDAVFAGIVQEPIQTICGENDFLILYDQKFYAVVRHYIPTDFYDAIAPPHQYHFHLEREGEKIFVILDIVGSNGIKMKEELVPISNAKRQLWGRART